MKILPGNQIVASARLIRALFMVLLAAFGSRGSAQSFVHPGGLHTQADLDRMKSEVAAGAHPWIDDWNVLITDPEAQNTYAAAPQADMGANRQRADADAHAAYLNAIRWYISGDTSYADCAVRICNAWSEAVNQVPSNTGLAGIPIFDFALAGEVLRIYSGWAPADFAQFQNMMETYLYPSSNSFLTTHNGANMTSYWANWDCCNIGALIAMGVLCDDPAKFNQGVTYFESGAGNGCIMNAVYVLYSTALGQWQESGRDQEHAQLGIGLLGSACQVAWNQGVDLFGYSNNRLLAGAEYVAQTNLMHPVPYTYYTNSDDANQDWVSINGMGRLDDRPVWELIYNHYAVLQGLRAPNSQAMAQLMRPEHGSADHFGYGTLTFTLSGTASTYPPLPVPATPTGLTATAGVSQVALNWAPSAVNAAQGYNVLRSTQSGGPYTTITSWNANTNPQYIDTTATNGSTYYYVVAAINQSGTSGYSAQASGTPFATGTLPAGWTNQDIGTVETSGSASYGSGDDGTFVVQGSGVGIGGTSDSGYNFTYLNVTGDFTLTARIWNMNWNSGGGEVGIMMRETLNPNASTVLMELGGSGQREAQMGFRTSSGSNLNHYNGNDYTVVPAWFRLRRSGNTFTISESSDGATWFAVGTSTQAMANTYYAGLFIFNGSTTLNSATFDHVTSTALSPPAGLSATPGPDENEVGLSWEADPLATSYDIERSTTSGSGYTIVATVSGTSAYTSTSYTDTGLTSGTTYYYVVTAVSGTSGSANSTQAGAIPIPPPPPPGNHTAHPVVNKIVLGWTPSLSATSYNVERSITSGSNYTTLAANVTGTSYTDFIATGGTTFYYAVSANSSVGTGPNSVELQLITSGTTDAGFNPYSGAITLGANGDVTFNESTGSYAGTVRRASGLAIYGGEAFITGTVSAGNEPANFLLIGSGAGGTDDSFGPLTQYSGPFFGKIAPNTDSNATITFGSLSRNPGTQLNFGHSTNFPVPASPGVGAAAIGTGTDNVSIVFSNAPTSLMVGGNGPGGTSTVDILPFVFVNNDLGTYDATYGLRGLNTSTEMATLASGMIAGQNARVNGNTTLTGTTSINALYGTGGTISGTGTLDVNSGAIVCNVGYVIGNSVLAFGSAEGEINVANSRTLTINSVITGTGGLTICLENYNNNNASVQLGGSNTYTGITTIEGNSANLLVTLTGGSAFQNTTLNYNNYGASLSFGVGASQVTNATLGGLEGAQNLLLVNSGSSGGALTLTVGGDGDSTVYSGVLSGSGGGIVKIGTGTLTLAGTCTYTGTTSVKAGTLSVSGNLASPVSVAAGGILGGAGSIGGAVTVAAGATVAPSGVLNLNGSLTLNGSSTLAFMLNGTPGQIAVMGAYSGPAKGVVTINAGAIGTTGTYNLITMTGGSNIGASSFQLGSLTPGYTYTLSATNGSLSLDVSVPPAPTGLVATGTTGAVTLSWNAASGATSYNVKRSVTSGAGYAVIASGSSGTTYIDTSVVNETTYYYVVSAVNLGGEGANSFEVNAKPYLPIAASELQAPAITTGTSPAGNIWQFVFTPVAGRTYQLEWTNSLAPPSWQNEGAAVTGSGEQIELQDLMDPAAPSRFYRILIQP